MIVFNTEKFKEEVKDELTQITKSSLSGVVDFIKFLPYSWGGFLVLAMLFAASETRSREYSLFSMEQLFQAIGYIFKKFTFQNAEFFLKGILIFGGVIFGMVILGVVVTKLITNIEIN